MYGLFSPQNGSLLQLDIINSLLFIFKFINLQLALPVCNKNIKIRLSKTWLKLCLLIVAISRGRVALRYKGG